MPSEFSGTAPLGQEGAAPGQSAFDPLMSLDMDIAAFASTWANCDRISSYVAGMISHNRTDSLLFANLFSSAFNELLETAFRAHGASGRFTCQVLRSGELDRVRLSVPGSPEVETFYRQTVSRLSDKNVAEHYRAALFADGPIDRSIGLLELAVDYEAELGIEIAGDTITLTADLALDKVKS
jgi:hypothetical protein